MGVLVIGEPGGTGQGDYDAMVRLLETAHACGAGCWKPQYASNADRHLARRSQHLSAVERRVFLARYRRAYHWLQWPVDWHADFRDRCHALGMFYACSVCLPEDVAVVAPFVDYLKISSFESIDRPLVLTAMMAGRVIISAGMGLSVRYDFRQWVAGRCYWPEAVLHCCSAYPAPLSDLNLSLVSGNGQIDGEPRYAGLSDHSKDIRVGGWAVSAGASIIEAHYRLDDCHPTNEDYAVAFSPSEFTAYIQNIRDAEIARGDGVKRLMSSEVEMAKLQIRDGRGVI